MKIQLDGLVGLYAKHISDNTMGALWQLKGYNFENGTHSGDAHKKTDNSN